MPQDQATETSTDITMLADDPAPQGKSGHLELPSFDLSLFKLPSFASLPNVTLPKLFKEAPCVLTSTLGTGACVPTPEACAGSGGEADGSCGLGLGVCCRKPVTCGGTIIWTSGSMAVVASPDFPAPTAVKAGSGDCLVTVNKKLDTHQVRLELQDFDLTGVDRSGSCSRDWMEVTGANLGSSVPRVCGLNTGHHLVLHVESTALTPVVIRFPAPKVAVQRLFRIRVTLVSKTEAELLAPKDCAQYYKGQSGVVRSFNYEGRKDRAIATVAGLKYTVCFKKEPGFCSLRLTPSFTRVSRSAYAYPPQAYPLQYPRPLVAGPRYPVAASRPVIYLRRPVLVRRPYISHPMVFKGLPSYAGAPMHYKYIPLPEKKVEEVDGLLAKKKLLIEELFGHKLPSLPTLAPLPSLEDLLLKKEKEIKDLVVKKEDKQPTYGYSKPDIKEIKEEKKEEVAAVLKGIEDKKQLVTSSLETLLKQKKQEIDDIIAKNQELVQQLLAKGVQLPSLPSLPSLDNKLPVVSAALEAKSDLLM